MNILSSRNSKNARKLQRLRTRQTAIFDQKKKERRHIVIGLCIVGSIAWVYVIFRLLGSSVIGIQNIFVSGLPADSVTNIQATAQNILDDTYLGIIPKSNAFLYPRHAIIQELLSRFPNIASVAVAVQGLHELHLDITEKKPAAVVCSGLPDLSATDETEDTCYFADDAGIIFSKAPVISGAVLNKYYFPELSTGTSTGDTILGTKATSTAEFANLQAFVSGVKAAGLNPISTLVKDGGEYEMYIDGNAMSTSSENEIIGKTSTAVVVYLNDISKNSSQLANLIAFWRAKKSDLDYIDVRFGSNIYYRKANQ
jgi:hypothetical protein